MIDKSFIIVNPKSYNFKSLQNYLKKHKVGYYMSYERDLKEIIRNKINLGISKFIICGGDGTINSFINLIMQLPDKQKNIVKIGIIPCGRANDFARFMKISPDWEKALKKVNKGNIKEVDLIKMNNNYMITGGGIGLPSEIIQDTNKFSSIFLGKFFKNILGEYIYSIFTLKKIILGYNGVEIKENKFWAIYIMNQPFIGKRFNIAPEAKNDDEYFDIKIIESPPSFIDSFITLFKGINGKLSELNWVKGKKSNKFSLILNNTHYFMGDGELLEKSNTFIVEIIPKAIKFIC